MTNRKTFHDSVLELPEAPEVAPKGFRLAQVEAEHAREEMRVKFGLAIDVERAEELERRVACGEILDPDELNSTYAVPQDDCDCLVEWLTSEGFTIEHVSDDRARIFTSAPVSQIEKSLCVEMVRVETDSGACTSARNAPSLPKEIAGRVNHIGGLQPFRRVKKYGRRINLSDKLGGKITLSLEDIRYTYGANNTVINGQGQTIGILIDRFPNDHDLETFWNLNKLSTSINQVTKINVTSTKLEAADVESTLDVEWASGIAPKSEIRIYASGTLRKLDLERALDKILKDFSTVPSMRQVSISFGLAESLWTPDELKSMHDLFSRLSAVGISVFVASGDTGSKPTTYGPKVPDIGVDYPASDPNVVAVGGSTLTVQPGPSGFIETKSETGWAGSGGGKSSIFKRPPWQAGAGFLDATDERQVPDIAAPADPEHGGLVIFNGSAYVANGTSWAAPICAGFCALLATYLQIWGQGVLPFLSPVLYGLAGTRGLRSIDKGSNGAYFDEHGHDMVTGLGSLYVTV